jgi:hypothetical protein
MIDIETETLIPLVDVPKNIPPSRSGRPMNRSAAFRWVQKGLRGVRLEAVQVGGRRMTSAQALSRFFSALSNNAGLATDPWPRTPRRRDKDIAGAHRDCEAAGI